jgi:hypothetical protein
MSDDSPTQVGASFEGKIRVAARVIDFLSSGLYQSPGSCLKELINNSYDADATTVVVSVKPDADFVAIEDDGEGMTRAAFERHFSNVAESHKRDSGEYTTSGKREKIGKIGIGFIAANELCDEMEVYSTCEGSQELLHVTIDFGEIRNRPFADRRKGNGSVEKGDYYGEILRAPPEEHYTKVYLKRLRESAQEALVSPSPTLEEMPVHTLYGKKPRSAREQLSMLKSFSELDPYSRTRTTVALNVPVPYPDDWVPSQYAERVSRFTRRAEALDFNVLYDGVRLEKPIVLTDSGEGSILRVMEYEGHEIRVAGYLFGRHGVLRPRELNGVLVRIREAGVGDHNRTFLGFPNNVHQLFQNWISGELYVDGLEDALNIDRRTLREVEPPFVELQTWFRSELSAFLKEVHDRLYKARSRERGASRARAQVDEVRAISGRVRSQIGEVAADAINEALASAHRPRTAAGSAVVHRASAAVDPETEEGLTYLLSDPMVLKRLNRRYSVAEILEIVVRVATEVLSPTEAARFIAEFARRLRD